ncbi:MAG: hypothetical protein LBT40_15500 [Deltaproteobacteria bacterium]|jgi:hypothetical protein|nr:hypothetical protein [Deltaproteobacteria bacterium]
MVRRPLFVEDAAWPGSCMSLTEVAMDVTEDGEEKHVLGKTFGKNDPDREKLRGHLMRFEMSGEE